VLKEIIQQILSGGMKSKQDIAQSIGVQLETLDDMLQLLLKKGMLRSSICEPIDGPSCSGCSSTEGSCSSNYLGQAYYVTERGKKYAQKTIRG
jgi:hypothetical protein